MPGLDEKKATYAPAYMVGIYPALADRARTLGYALALHGSLKRDLDIIAIPWTEAAVDPNTLLLALCEEFDVATNNPLGLPEAKPHGRLCWTIPLWWGAYLDFSVMPPIKDNTNGFKSGSTTYCQP
jgi:hypothetical protein